ncbi:MAG TPA: adenosine deaminase [Thermoleophilia bacterium]|nr:adenosine deaminase [Thermoleophilia bacterium]
MASKRESAAQVGEVTPYPKAELHVHLEATVSPARVREIARRNGLSSPVFAEAGPPALHGPTDFAGFIHSWIAMSGLLSRGRDFHEIVVDYAAEVAAQGCVYIEAIFSPAEPARRGTPWQEIFEGYCSGADAARELHGVEIRFTPDVTRDFPPESGEVVARWAVRFRERGVVGIGLGGSESAYPPELFARPFEIARGGGLRSAPHAGEMAGAASLRAALDVLRADRLRHGVRAVEDAALLAEIAARGIVCDVAPTSNLHLGVVPSLGRHPLPQMLAAGVKCSISTDDPALMATDLTRECDVATLLGHTPRDMFSHALDGAFCEDSLRARLRTYCASFDWGSVGEPAGALKGLAT